MLGVPVAWTSFMKASRYKLQILISVWSSKPWFRIRIHLKCWIRIHNTAKRKRDDYRVAHQKSWKKSKQYLASFFERNVQTTIVPDHDGNLQDWLQEGSLCDLQLCCKNGRLAAHTAVLAAHSWLFRSWSSGGGGDKDLEVILPDSNIKQVRNGRTSDQ